MAVVRSIVFLSSLLLVLGSFGVGCGGCNKSNKGDMQTDSVADGSFDQTPIDAVDGTDAPVEQPTLKIIEPKNGQSFSQADEDPKYNSKAGLQLDIQIRTTNLHGENIELYIGGAYIGAQVVTETGGVGTVVFPGVTISKNGAVEIRVEGRNATLVDSVSINVDLGFLCTVTVEPSNSSCLLVDANPGKDGFQVKFTVKNDNGCDSAFIEFQSVGGTVKTSATVALQNGEAEIEVDLTTDSTAVDGMVFMINAVVEDSKDPKRKAPTTQLPYRVDTQDPVVELTKPPISTIGKANDSDPNKDGIQFSFSGTVSGVTDQQVDSITLLIDGTEVAKTTPTAQGTFQFKDVTFDKSGTFSVVARVNDGCRSVDSDAFNLTAALEVAAVKIVSPADKDTLLAKDDTDKASSDTYETQFTVEATDVAVNDELQIRCKQGDGPEIPVGSLTITQVSGDGQYSVSVSIPAGSQSCRAAVVSVNPVQSEPITIAIGLPAPELSFSSPADDSLVKTHQMPVVLSAKHLTNRQATVTITDQNDIKVLTDAPLGTLLGEFGLSTTIALVADGGSNLPDGTYTITVNATDIYGNLASASVKIALDTAGPSVVISTPAGINPTVNTDKDNNLDNGFQTDVVITVTGADADGGTVVCLELNGNRKQCKVLGAGEMTATFTPTLLQGANQLVAYATDKAGNKSAVLATKTVHADYGGLRVEITAPAQDTASTSKTFSISVKVTDGASNVDGATLTVRKSDGTQVAITGGSSTTAADGTATFTIDVAPGENALIVVAEKNPKKGTSDTLRLIYLENPPKVTLDDLAENDAINAQSVLCLAGLTDCQLDVSATVENIPESTEATLTATCGSAAPVNVTATVQNGKLLFKDAVLNDQSSCAIAVKIDDFGLGYDMPAVNVNVDRLPPRVVSFANPGKTLTYVQDLDPATPGVQITMGVVIAGVEKDQEVTVVVTQPDQTQQTHKATVPSDVADDAVLHVPFSGSQTLNDGIVKLTATVVDKAGNVSRPFTIFVSVTSEKPSVALTQPLKQSEKWGSTSERKVLIQLNNFPPNTPVRVCSKNGAVGSTACTSAGYFVAVTSTAVAGVALMDLSSLPDGVHEIVVEAFFEPTQSWVSSLDNPSVNFRSRMLDINTTLPVISNFTSPSNANQDGFLNKSEVESGTTMFKFSLDGDKSGQVQILVNGNKVVDAAHTGPGTFETVLQLAERPTQAHKVTARLVDGYGNVSVPLDYIIKVDVTPPNMTFASPLTSPVTMSGSDDVVVRTVAPDPSITSQTVTLLDDGVAFGTTAVVNTLGEATFADILVNKANNAPYKLSFEVSDQAGNKLTLAHPAGDIVVDVRAPKISAFGHKGAGGTQKTPPTAYQHKPAGSDDVNQSRPGLQLTAVINAQTNDTQPDDAPTRYNLYIDYECTDASTCTKTRTIVLNAPFNGPTTEREFDVPPASVQLYVLRVEVLDAVGNKATETSSLLVESSICEVALTNLLRYYNRSNVSNLVDGPPATGGTELDVLVSAGCPATIKKTELLHDGNPLNPPLVNSVSPFNKFTFKMEDGATYNLTVRVTFDDNGSDTVVDSQPDVTTADFTLPTISLLVHTYKTSNNLTVNGPTLTDTPVCTFANQATANVNCFLALHNKNANPDNGLAIELKVQVDDTNLEDGRFESANLATPKTITSGLLGNPIVLGSLESFSLQKGENQVITVTVFDAAGNSASVSFTASADPFPPENPANFQVQSGTLNHRLPAVTLDWTASSEDGKGVTPISAFDFRYSYSVIDDTNFTDACEVSKIPGHLALPTPAAPGTPNETFTISGPDARDDACKFKTLPPDSTDKIYFALRVRDKLGNWSGAVFTDASVKWNSTKVSFANFTGDWGSVVHRIGDIDGDGLPDVALGGDGTGGFCILFGRTFSTSPSITIDQNTPSDATNGYHCFLNMSLTLADDTPVAMDNIGASIFSVGDFDGDGTDDFVVTGKTVALLYRGNKDGLPDSTPSVIVTGLLPVTGGPPVSGDGANLIAFNDEEQGKTFNDIVLTSSGEDRVYVIAGRALTPNQVIEVNVSANDATAFRNKRVLAYEMTDDQVVPTPAFGKFVAAVGPILSPTGLKDLLVTKEITDPGVGRFPAVILLPGLTGLDPANYEVIRTISEHLPADDNSKTATDKTLVFIEMQLSQDADKPGLVPKNHAAADLLKPYPGTSFDFDRNGTADIILHNPQSNLCFRFPVLCGTPSPNVANFSQFVLYGEYLKDKAGTKLAVVQGDLDPVVNFDIYLLKDTADTRYGVAIQNPDLNNPAVLDYLASGLPGMTYDLAFSRFLSFVSPTENSILIRSNLDTAGVGQGTFPFNDYDDINDPFKPTSTNWSLYSLKSIGDFNGDKIPDLLVGTTEKDTNGNPYSVILW